MLQSLALHPQRKRRPKFPSLGCKLDSVHLHCVYVFHTAILLEGCIRFNKNHVSLRRPSAQEGGGFKGALCTPACKYNSLLRHYQKELIVSATHHISINDSQVHSLMYNIAHSKQSSES